jgi:hypothetical protein
MAYDNTNSGVLFVNKKRGDNDRAPSMKGNGPPTAPSRSPWPGRRRLGRPRPCRGGRGPSSQDHALDEARAPDAGDRHREPSNTSRNQG